MVVPPPTGVRTANEMWGFKKNYVLDPYAEVRRAASSGRGSLPWLACRSAERALMRVCMSVCVTAGALAQALVHRQLPQEGWVGVCCIASRPARCITAAERWCAGRAGIKARTFPYVTYWEDKVASLIEYFSCERSLRKAISIVRQVSTHQTPHP